MNGEPILIDLNAWWDAFTAFIGSLTLVEILLIIIAYLLSMLLFALADILGALRGIAYDQEGVHMTLENIEENTKRG
jgi:hypothetical protein